MTQTVFNFAIEYQQTIIGNRNDVKIAKGQIALLRHLLAAKDNLGSLDGATTDLTMKFADNGKWRGWVCLGLSIDGLITEVGAVNSQRPPRNRGLLRRWRLVDAGKAKRKIKSLESWLEGIENPPTAGTVGGSSKANDTKSKSGENENASI
ncbi:MAG: hypothetical protein Q8M16_11480 [Pirellulaceae bacterium]|nr:hypothetical protein [Pirellulaceae bacterium]